MSAVNCWFGMNCEMALYQIVGGGVFGNSRTGHCSGKHLAHLGSVYHTGKNSGSNVY